MKLRKSIVLIIFGCFGLLVAVLVISSHGLTYRKFDELEEQIAAANVRRSINAIQGINASLGQLVADWSYWDDSYRFVQEKNQEFIDENLVVDTFEAQQNNLIILFNNRRELVWGANHVSGAEQLSPVPDETLVSLQQLLDDRSINKRQQGFDGIVVLQQEIFVLSCRAVLTTNRQGPSTGWIVMGKKFGPAMLDELEQRTELELEYINLATDTIPPIFPTDLQENRSGGLFPVIEKSETTIRCTGVLADVQGTPVGLLTVDAPRTVYLSGVEASRRLLIVIVAAGVAVGGLILWLLERKILSRIDLLNTQVNSIEQSDPSRFTTLAGRDEISDLSRSIFSMLNKIEQSFNEIRIVQESLSESEERFRSLFMNTGNPMVMVDAEAKIQLANQEFCRSMNNPEEQEVIGRSWNDFFPPEEIERMQRYHQARRRGDASAPRTYEVRYFDLVGRQRCGILTVAMIPGTDSSTVSLLDITDLKQAEEELARKAFYDSLTKLPNQRLFHDRVQQASKRAARAGTQFGVVLLDIDDFKNVNDTLGHHAGDEVLQQIADRLARCVRKSDTIARLGGDEFTLLIEPPGQPECFCRIAEKIIADFSRPYSVQEMEFYLGVSIGIAVYPIAGSNADTLLKNADLAMYESKTKGKNRYHLFTPALNEQAQRRTVIDRFVRNAIAADQFAVFYQAKISLDDGRLRSMEALVRGIDIDGSLVSPGEFLPYAEAHGLIVPIDLFVLRTACRQIADWQQEGLGQLAVAVNISTKHFRKEGFVEEVEHILEEIGLPPAALELEITESALMKEIEQANDSLRRFRDAGISVALDDFGTGYSSLNYLRTLPIQTLKIDRSFINSICDEGKGSLELVTIILSLAAAMRMNVVAEGIETPEQLKLLQRLGCNQGQGYLFSKPLPADEFREFLIRHNRAGNWPDETWFPGSGAVRRSD
ncbi:bifunctional diguanylate cyclase/phosphodiesterase [Desulfofustis glycolicus]|nr:EAL domain-containing protein [Desulfofustis glycolicus]